MLKGLLQFGFILIGITLRKCICDKIYVGYKVVSITPEDQSQAQTVISLIPQFMTLFEDHLSIENIQPNIRIMALVPPTSFANVEAQLFDKNIHFSVKIHDLHRHYQKIQRANRRQHFNNGLRWFHHGFHNRKFEFDIYHTHREIRQYLSHLQSRYPYYVKMIPIGRSHEWRPMEVLRISTTRWGNQKPKPAIWIDGGIHAREWLSPATVLYFIKKLTQGLHSRDQNLRKYVENIDWYILPVVNPDGYEFSRSGRDIMWRKNRGNNKGQDCDICLTHLKPEDSVVNKYDYELCLNGSMGTDLNRNFGFNASLVSLPEYRNYTSPCPSHIIYHGKSPFSEPESQAVRNFVMQNKKRIKAFITVHSYSQLWLMPDSNVVKQEDADDMMNVSKKAAEAIESVYRTEYKYGMPDQFLYPVTGGSCNWSYKEAGIKYSFTIELRPGPGNSTRQTRLQSYQFLQPAHQILPTAIETWEGIKVVADKIIQEYA